MGLGKWEQWEVAYLEGSYMAMTDKAIGDHLGRKAVAIYRKRKMLGLKKTENGKPITANRKGVKEMTSDILLAQMSKVERVKFYKSHFEKNWRYIYLTNVMLTRELEYYKHRYIDVIDSLESISYIEEDLVHNMVFQDVMQMRIQTTIKNQMEAMEEDSDAAPVQQYLYKDLHDAQSQYVKFQKELAITRQQRLKDHKEDKVSIASIVEGLLDKKARASANRLAGELDFHAKKCRSEMTKMDFLLGGDDILGEKK